MQALDELVTRWRKNPDSEATLALCAHLGTSKKSDLMREVGNAADAWHRDNHPVMLSVGRMYLDAGLLAEAQAAFVQAGKLSPGDSEAYRFLGEVLLRRGDAVRGEKAIARAIKLGNGDATTRLWHERSVVYSALQQRRGMRAVADEVARTAPLQPSIPAPTLNPFELEPPRAARGTRRSRPPAAPAARPSGPRRSSPPTVRRRQSTPPAAATVREAPGTAKSAPLETLLMGSAPLPVPQVAAPVHPPSPFFPSDSHAPDRRAPKRAAQPFPAVTRSAPRREPAALRPVEPPAPFFPPDPPAPPAPESQSLPSDPFRGTFPEEPVAAAPDPSLGASMLGPGPVSLKPEPLFAPSSADQADLQDVEELPGAHRVHATDGVDPGPEAILLSLAQVGLYETKNGVVPAWEAAPRTPPRRLWLGAAGLLLTLGMGFGAYKYLTGIQVARLARAQELGTQITGLLESGTKKDLLASEADFQSLFELDSRGREAALLWLENRVLHALIGDVPVSGIESALQRGRAVGIDEPRLVFGRLASALAAGDLPGAGQIIQEWDSRVKDDAWFQLVAGTVFERAGNAEALQRFAAATTLQPSLKLAHLMAARLALIQLGPTEAKGFVERAEARLGSGPATELLRGLQWATTPTEAPAPSLPVASALEDHPALLVGTLSAVEAVRAAREGRADEAAAAFRRALGTSSTPALAAWIGYQALEAGDVETARTAAIEAMKLSALHANNQTLAVRIALAEGRLAQAREAAASLDQSSREALLVEAVSAYESLRGGDVTRLLAGTASDPTSLANSEALRAGEKVLLGQLRPQPGMLDRFARSEQVWGPLVAVDLALDHGALDFADKLMQSRSWDASRPTQAARILRLRRYRAEFDAALELVRPLSDPAQATPRSITESVLALADAGRLAAAASHLEQARDRAGDYGPWLQALVDAAGDQRLLAAKSVAALDLPAKAQPVLLQVVALRALAATKDKRAAKYSIQLTERVPSHPDLRIAREQLARKR